MKGGLDMAKYLLEFLLYRERERRMILPGNRLKWEIETEDIAAALFRCTDDERREEPLLRRFVDRTVWAKKSFSWHLAPPGLLRKRNESYQDYCQRCEDAEKRKTLEGSHAW